MHSRSSLEQALSLLGETLGEDPPRERMIISGGAALSLRGIVTRTTRDVDVVAMIDDTGILDARPLPAPIEAAAQFVARTLGLNDDWLNNGPASQINFGFPAGFIDRLEERRYAPKLVVYFVGRLDQIHFKLFAAVDQGPGKHTSDLQSLRPTNEEMAIAAAWVKEQDASSLFRTMLRETLAALGFAGVADGIT